MQNIFFFFLSWCLLVSICLFLHLRSLNMRRLFMLVWNLFGSSGKSWNLSLRTLTDKCNIFFPSNRTLKENFFYVCGWVHLIYWNINFLGPNHICLIFLCTWQPSVTHWLHAFTLQHPKTEDKELFCRLEAIYIR